MNSSLNIFYSTKKENSWPHFSPSLDLPYLHMVQLSRYGSLVNNTALLAMQAKENHSFLSFSCFLGFKSRGIKIRFDRFHQSQNERRWDVGCARALTPARKPS